jgi:predicted kinase
LRLLRTPAVERLEWILAGIEGAEGWGSDATSVLAPAFTTIVPPAVYVDRVRARSKVYAPVGVVGVDVAEHTATARLRRPDGDVDVLSCEVEPEPPHRITMTWVLGVVPANLTPRLPMDFTDYDMPTTTPKSALVVFSGVPGSGKSTLAETTGRELSIPVFAIDWLLGALTPFGGRHFADLVAIGVEQQTTLALRQLTLGQSAILDSPVEDPVTRARWSSLARRANADFKVIVCTCSDSTVHRSRVEGRQRGIPGWHDGGDWANVSKRLAAFPPWDTETLEVDTMQPREDSLAAVVRYLAH